MDYRKFYHEVVIGTKRKSFIKELELGGATIERDQEVISCLIIDFYDKLYKHEVMNQSFI